MKKIILLFIIIVSFTCLTVNAQEAAALTVNDIKQVFDGFGVKGTFLFYELKNDKFTIFNEERADKSFLPASTFKILNSMIALETGAIKDDCEKIEWDRKNYRFDGWNQDQTLKTAFQYSAVWAYQELARRIGEKQMKYWVDKVGYGNGDISGGIDTFWLSGELRITPRQQVEFLKKLYRNELPFSKRTVDIVKEIMIVDQGPNYILRAKTGWAGGVNPEIGWFVGYLEKGDDVYIFAINIDILNQKDAKARIEIPKEIFKKLKLME